MQKPPLRYKQIRFDVARYNPTDGAGSGSLILTSTGGRIKNRLRNTLRLCSRGRGNTQEMLYITQELLQHIKEMLHITQELLHNT